MEYILYALTGLISGVLGGMGMGGGTVLIPALTILFSVEQHTAQAINIISFIPMAVVALIIHIKNKLVDFKSIFYIIVSGVIFCFLGAFLAKNISGENLKRIFGGFLIVLSVVQFITVIKRKNE